MEKLEELNYHVDFGPYYVHLTRKQKKYLAVRSVIDRILAVLALVLLSPLFLAVSIAQKVSAPDEPIFFLQKRVGKGAHCFNIIKFRTMKSSAPKNVATGDLENPQMYIEELRKQREAFKTFAENKRNAVLVDATQDAKQVADSITEKVLRYKAEQTAKLMHCTLDDEGVPV